MLLFPGELLNEGVVHADLGTPGAFIGGLLDTNGGLIASGKIRLLAGPGAIGSQSLVQLQSLDVTNFMDLVGSNFIVVGAFEVGLTGVLPGQDLSLQITGVPANALFVLARVIERNGLFGLEPRERMHSDVGGHLVSDEPASGDRLPGLTAAGQYVLLEVQPQQALVAGIAKNSNGREGIAQRVAGRRSGFCCRIGGIQFFHPSPAQPVQFAERQHQRRGAGVSHNRNQCRSQQRGYCLRRHGGKSGYVQRYRWHSHVDVLE